MNQCRLMLALGIFAWIAVAPPAEAACEYGVTRTTFDAVFRGTECASSTTSIQQIIRWMGVYTLLKDGSRLNGTLYKYIVPSYGTYFLQSGQLTAPNFTGTLRTVGTMTTAGVITNQETRTGVETLGGDGQAAVQSVVRRNGSQLTVEKYSQQTGVFFNGDVSLYETRDAATGALLLSREMRSGEENRGVEGRAQVYSTLLATPSSPYSTHTLQQESELDGPMFTGQESLSRAWDERSGWRYLYARRYGEEHLGPEGRATVSSYKLESGKPADGYHSMEEQYRTIQGPIFTGQSIVTEERQPGLVRISESRSGHEIWGPDGGQADVAIGQSYFLDAQAEQVIREKQAQVVGPAFTGDMYMREHMAVGYPEYGLAQVVQSGTWRIGSRTFTGTLSVRYDGGTVTVDDSRQEAP